MKIMGLELSEEMWRKRCEEQSRDLAQERRRLDAWEAKIKDKENLTKK